jgi:tetratricopeptide (TPR) repeat protein
LNSGGTVIGICVFLVAITWVVFGQTLRYHFVDYDDNIYIYQDPVVTSGVTSRGVAWTFTHKEARNWHPLTTISHMVDCQLYGLKPGGHHFTNVLLHTAAAILLFLLLQQMTGALWRSAFVAAVFAIHPLRVESVGVFFMLTLAAFVWYVRKPALARYVTMSILFACGLMSKPMLVTLPFVLLLLDYWPLRRCLDRQSISRLILEKIPLLVLVAGSCIATLLAQTQALNSVQELPLRLRISNSLVAYLIYIRQMFWPARLAVFYPHPYNRLPFLEVVLATALLLAITALAFALRKPRPYFITGWLWYLLMLLPVIGVVQVGDQAHADRYTYLPQIGLYILSTWAIVDLAALRRYRGRIVEVAAAIVIVALGRCAWIQTSHWRDSASLWTHTLNVTSNNSVALHHLGILLLKRGQLDDAIAHFQKALSIRVDTNDGRVNRLRGLVHLDLGNALALKGLMDAAISEYKRAVQLRPDYANAHYTLGNALLGEGEIDEAIAQCREALSLAPQSTEVSTTLGNALLRKGQVSEAITYYERSLEIDRGSVTALNNLAWVLSTCPDGSLRNGPRAIELAKKAVEFSAPQNPTFMRTLAAAYAESGRFNDAIELAEQALQVVLPQKNSALASSLHMDIDLYRMKFPLRQSRAANGHNVP